MATLNDVSLDQIYGFIRSGNPKDAPKEIVHYLEMMDKVRGMYLRKLDYPTRTMIINHLIKVDGLSYYLADKLYNQTIEYFYCSTPISKKAWNNLYAEQLDNLAALAMALIKDPRDAKAVAGIIKEARLARQLDEQDIPEIPAALLERPFKLYAMDPEFVGLAPINRLELARIIDEIPDMPEREKDRIKSDAAINPIILFQDEQKDVRKQ